MVEPAPYEMNNTIEFTTFGAEMHFLWFFKDKKEHKTNCTLSSFLKIVTCLNTILSFSRLTEEAKKVGFTQKWSIENYLCILQVNDTF